MDNQLLKTDQVLTNEQVLTYYLNMFKDKLVANIVDLNHYQNIKVEMPDYKTRNQMGELVTIDQIITGHRNGARYARNNIRYIESLLEKEEQGTLGEVWGDAALNSIVSPIQDIKKSDTETEDKSE